jgi:DNA helicase-2/ATP-dependent DNA helicase PcrA
MDSLNEKQKEAVLHTEGPVLILAGAGAGKTKTLTHRILHLVEQGVFPREILAITFTNKAGKEMRERVGILLQKRNQDLRSGSGGASAPHYSGDFGIFDDEEMEEKPVVGPVSGFPFISTFHSLGVHIIKENAEVLGLPRHFGIFDRGDSKRAVKEALLKAGFDPKQFDPANVLAAISKEKGDAVSLKEFEAAAGNDYLKKVAASVWKFYEEILKKEKALDFDDLLLKSLLLLKNHPEIREKYQSTWKYVHIDEYQDTNRAQYQMAKLLAEKHRNICVVGDIDQNIYSWRGADIKNILNFEKDYPEGKVILLEENYRSTNIILKAANEVIKKNVNRREKNLFTRKEGGELISIYNAYDEADEADYISRTSMELIEKGVPADEIAVLYRANYQSRIIEESFLSRNIAHQVLGVRFYERKEIKDALSYLKLSLNPESETDFKRVINVPARGIGKVSLDKIVAGNLEGISSGARHTHDRFQEMLLEIRKVALSHKVSDTLAYILKVTGLRQMYKEGKSEDEDKVENLEELVTLGKKYDHFPANEGIEAFLEDVSLQSDQDELDKNKKGVKLLTVHASKGLEFDYVFIAGMEEELFPHKRMNESRINDDQMEEERRLFYVALTRARKKLYLSYALVRTIFGMKKYNLESAFVNDIPSELVQRIEANLGIKSIFIDY